MMEKHISSGAVIHILEKNVRKFLIMHREKTNSWHLPKGTQIYGESLEETSLRETKEETGLDVEIERYIGKIDSVYKKSEVIIEKETHYFLVHPKNKDFIFDKHDNEHDLICFYDYEAALGKLTSFSLYENESSILTKANIMVS